jgi:hypothetical protein
LSPMSAFIMAIRRGVVGIADDGIDESSSRRAFARSELWA